MFILTTTLLWQKQTSVILFLPYIHNIFCILNLKIISCSSDATKTRAKVLAEEIGSWHLDVSIDGVVSALLSLFQRLTGKQPRYKVKGEG